jgi:hypothetical protein
VEELLEAVFSMQSMLKLYKENSDSQSVGSETVKYGHESQGTQTRERLRWRGSVAYTKDRPVLLSERAPQKNKTVTVKEL